MKKVLSGMLSLLLLVSLVTPVHAQLGGKCGQTELDTAIGCIPIFSGGNNSLTPFMTFVLGWGTGIAGGIAFLLILFAGFQIMTSSGNPQKLQAGKELLGAAVSGLLLLIFSAFILRIVGVDILQIFT